MWPGFIALLIALVVAAAFALHRRRVDGRFRPAAVATASEANGAERLTAADLGAPLGRSATVVQFSSEYCAPCRAAQRVITDAVAGLDGVRYLDIDSEQKLDLVRRLNILRTPTILITDDAGRILARTAGVPTKQSLYAVLPAGAS